MFEKANKFYFCALSLYEKKEDQNRIWGKIKEVNDP